MTYPPADDRLRHLIAQQINPSVATWKLAFFLADAIVTSPEVRSELDRIADAHAAGKPCGDRQCHRCFEAVAGIRDAARQAAGQTTHHIPCGQCGAPWSDGHGQPGDPCTAAGQTTTAVCAHCQGSGADPEDDGDWMPEVGMHNPRTGGPCPKCNGTGQHTCPDGEPCPGHDEPACPTPETHNWGCGCPTDQLPGHRIAEAVAILHDAMDHGVKDPVTRQKLIGQLVGACHHAAELRAAVEQPAEAQPAEAHPADVTFAIEKRGDTDWLLASSHYDESDREKALGRLARRREQYPDTEFRLVRETTTWTVEETS